MRYITITVADEYVQGGGVTAGAAGSHNDVALVISFGDMWDGTTKTIVWHDANGENPVFTLLTDAMLNSDGAYIVPIPAEPKAIEGRMSMTIKGAVLDTADTAKESYATITATAYFNILGSAWDADAATAADVSATMAEQLLAQTTENTQKIEKNTQRIEKITTAGEEVKLLTSEIAADDTLTLNINGVAVTLSKATLTKNAALISGIADPVKNTDAANKQYVDTKCANADAYTTQEVENSLETHTANTTVHVTADEKATWNAKLSESDAEELEPKYIILTIPADGWQIYKGEFADGDSAAATTYYYDCTDYKYSDYVYGNQKIDIQLDTNTFYAFYDEKTAGIYAQNLSTDSDERTPPIRVFAIGNHPGKAIQLQATATPTPSYSAPIYSYFVDEETNAEVLPVGNFITINPSPIV